MIYPKSVSNFTYTVIYIFACTAHHYYADHNSRVTEKNTWWQKQPYKKRFVFRAQETDKMENYQLFKKDLLLNHLINQPLFHFCVYLPCKMNHSRCCLIGTHDALPAL